MRYAPLPYRFDVTKQVPHALEVNDCGEALVMMFEYVTLQWASTKQANIGVIVYCPQYDLISYYRFNTNKSVHKPTGPHSPVPERFQDIAAQLKSRPIPEYNYF
jgi:hypothetical protein